LYNIPVKIEFRQNVKKVLIIEDSEVIRKILVKVFKHLKNCEIVGIAGRVDEAVSMFNQFNPDFISLDLKLENGTGLDFLKAVQFQQKYKSTKKCLLVTDCSVSEGSLVFDALALGAQDYLQKPRLDDIASFTEVIEQFLKQSMQTKSNDKLINLELSKVNFDLAKYDYILIGSSTGGTEVVRDILKGLPENSPPAIVVQHMPSHFTRLYAERLQKQTKRKTLEVTQAMKIEKGCSYVAAGGLHSVFVKNAAGQINLDISDGPPVNRFKPSISVLFQSAFDNHLAAKCLTIMLTGMGSDGAQEMLKLKQQGSFTIGQSERSCVVYGMPKAAFEIGAVSVQLSPEEIITFLNYKKDKTSKIA